jgi:hypothetical protein
VFAILTSTFAFSQTESIPESSSTFNRFSVGISISPDYCYRTLEDNKGSTISAYIIDERDKREIPKFCVSYGLNIGYNLSNQLMIETGVYYSSKGYAYDFSGLTFGDMIDPRYNFIYGSQSTEIMKIKKRLYNFNYLDIPIRAIYNFGENKISLIASAGLIANVFLNANSQLVYENVNGDTNYEKQNIPYKYKSITISTVISAGLIYNISNKINLRAEPTFRYSFVKNSYDSPIDEYLWSAGLNISGNYKF